MKHIRAVIRLLLIAVYTILLYSVLMTGMGLIRLFRRDAIRWRTSILRMWGRGAAWIFQINIVTEGGERPKPPFFLVSNHLSYIDIFVYYALVRGTFIAMKELKSWPLVGFLTKTVGVIFIDRSLRSDVKRVNLKISGHLTQSQGIVLFPEGKTSDGSAVLPFRPSLLEHPVRTGLPVHYAVIRYETVQGDIPANESVCWWENVFFPTHIYKLAMLRKIICTVRFGDCEYRSADRKDLARHLWQEVSDRFAPMTDGG